MLQSCDHQSSACLSALLNIPVASLPIAPFVLSAKLSIEPKVFLGLAKYFFVKSYKCFRYPVPLAKCVALINGLVSLALKISSPGLSITGTLRPLKMPNSPVAGRYKASRFPVSGLSLPSFTTAKVGLVIGR